MKKTDIYLAKAIRLISMILIAVGIVACHDDFEFRHTEWNETYDADEVAMTLALAVAPIESVDPSSRAITYVEATPEEKIITDVWIIEYNEEGNRVGLPHYYEISNSVTDGRVDPIVIDDFKLLVPREPDHEYTCVVIANTHNDQLFRPDNRSKFSSLDSLRVYDIDVHNQEDLFVPYPEDHHVRRYLHMSGWTKINKDTTEFKVDLIRNTCKVNVKLTNFCFDDLTIKYIQWVDMPQGKLFPHGIPKHYVESACRDWRMHNEEDYYDLLMNDEGLTFWIPCNVWLPEDGISGQSDNGSVITEDPTHFDIVCRKNEGDDIHLYEFRIYPSRDANVQCKFEPNHYYQIEVEIDGIPADENDFFKIKKFKDLGQSNSYILQQDTKGTYVIDLSRPNVFWSHFDGSNLIEDGTEWVAEVIWQDTDQRVMDFAIFSIGEVSPDRSRFFGESDTYIPFRTTGTGLGNVIIGVRMRYYGEEEMTKDELDAEYPVEYREYLWSWHLWITDYQPDMVGDISSTPGVNGAFYQVPGGQVIQMGINKMMDRNLGAWAPEVNDPTNPDDIIKTFGFYYQYGRKDPFPYFNPDRKPIYDIDGNLIPAFNSQTVDFWLTKRVPIVDENGRDVLDNDGNATYDYVDEERSERITMMSSAVTGETGSFAAGVMRPYMFWADVNTTYNWASDAGEIEMAYGWYASQWYLDATGDLKDIFDPCPAGWTMASSEADFYEGSNGNVLSGIEEFYGQDQYLLWKGTINADPNDDQSLKFEDTEENRAMIKEYLKLEQEFWEDLNSQGVSNSNAQIPFMGSWLYYRDKPGYSYFPAAGSRNRYGAGDRFNNYMCLPWYDIMMRLSSFGWSLFKDWKVNEDFCEEGFSTATAMQVRCVRL